MELQLGLAISSLNYYGYEPNYKAVFGCTELVKNIEKKRWFDEAFGENVNDDEDDDDDHVPHTLPLFSKDDHEDKRANHDNNSFITNKSTDGDESSVIGWPPIKSWRKKHCYQNHGNYNRTMEINHQCSRGSNSTYVKVKMEGVGIARKVDLSLYDSYQTLTNTLIPMFGKCLENVNAYKLTYQDTEGDWLLAGDLPWGTFTRSVQRLKLLKNDG